MKKLSWLKFGRDGLHSIRYEDLQNTAPFHQNWCHHCTVPSLLLFIASLCNWYLLVRYQPSDSGAGGVGGGGGCTFQKWIICLWKQEKIKIVSKYLENISSLKIWRKKICLWKKKCTCTPRISYGWRLTRDHILTIICVSFLPWIFKLCKNNC